MAEIDDENIVNEDNQYSRVDDTTTEPPFNFLQPGFSFAQHLSDKITDPVTTYPAVDVTPDMGLSPYMKTYLDNVQSGAKKAMSNADFGYLGGYFDKKYEAALRAVDQNIQQLNISEEDKANMYKDQKKIDQYVKVYNNFRDSGGDINNFVLFAPSTGIAFDKSKAAAPHGPMERVFEDYTPFNLLTPKQQKNKLKRQHEKEMTKFDQQFLIVNSKFMSQTEESAITILGQKFGSMGFDFAQAGGGTDYITVTPRNGADPMTFSFDENSPDEAIRLQSFLRNNASLQNENATAANRIADFVKKNRDLNKKPYSSEEYYNLFENLTYFQKKEEMSRRQKEASGFEFSDYGIPGYLVGLVYDTEETRKKLAENAKIMQGDLYNSKEWKLFNTEKSKYESLQMERYTRMLQDYEVAKLDGNEAKIKQAKLTIESGFSKNVVGDNVTNLTNSQTDLITANKNYSEKVKKINVDGELLTLEGNKLENANKNYSEKLKKFNEQVSNGLIGQKEYDATVESLKLEAKEIENASKNYSEKSKIYNFDISRLKIEGDELNIAAKNIVDNQKTMQILTGEYVSEKAKYGSFAGNMWNGFVVNVAEIIDEFNYIRRGGIDVESIIGNNIGVQSRIITPEQKEYFKNKGYDEEQIKNIRINQENLAARKAFKKSIIGAIGSDLTTEESKSKLGFVEGALVGLSESLPSMLTRFIPVVGQATAFVSMANMSYNAIEEEMLSDPDFEATSKTDRAYVAVPYALVMGYLENLGVSKMTKGKSAILGKYVFGQVAKVVGGGSKETIEQIVAKEVKNVVAKGVLKVVGGTLAEAETGAIQTLVADIGIKKAYNYFRSAYTKEDLEKLTGGEAFATPQTITEGAVAVGEGAVAEAIGGFAMTTVMVGTQGLVTGNISLYDKEDLKFFEDFSADKEFKKLIVSNLKSDMLSGKITKIEAQDALNNIDLVSGIFNSIDKKLSEESQMEAFNLISERKRLEKEIEGKDPSLVDAQKKRVSEINESLKTISNNAAKETTNKQQAGTAEGGVSEYQGTSEGQPEGGQVEGGQREATVNETDSRNSTIPSKVQEEVTTYRAEEQAELLKVIPKIENYKVNGEVDKTLMPKTVLDKYNKVYNKYDKLISPLLETAAPKSVVQEEVVPGTAAKVADIDIVYPTQKQAEERKALRSTTEYVENASKELPVENIDVLSKELGGEFGLLTAENPMAQPLTEEENKQLNQKAKEWLTSKGYNPRRITGKYNQAENSFFVPKLTKQDAIEFAKQFNQESVAHSDGLVYQDGSMNPRVKEDDNLSFADSYSPDSDFVSVANTKDGLKTFSIGYNFDEKIRPEKQATKKLDYKQNLITPENVREVASKQDTPLKQKIAKSAAMIMKSLPGVKIYLHNNQSEMHQAIADTTGRNVDDISDEVGNAAGAQIKKEIHVNMDTAKETTILHEAFHEAILRSGKSFQTITDFANGLKNIISDKDVKAKLDKFISMYNESDRAEEFLSELGAIMSEAETELTTTKFQKFLNLINRIARSLGLPVIIKSSATAQEAVDFINYMSKSLRTGKAIEGDYRGEGKIKRQDIELNAEIKKSLSEQDSIKIAKEVVDKTIKGKAIPTWVQKKTSNKVKFVSFSGEINQKNVKENAPSSYNSTAAKFSNYNTFNINVKQELNNSLAGASKESINKALEHNKNKLLPKINSLLKEIVKIKSNKKLTKEEKLSKISLRNEAIVNIKKIAKMKDLNDQLNAVLNIEHKSTKDSLYNSMFYDLSTNLKRLKGLELENKSEGIYKKAKDIVKSNLLSVYNSVSPRIRQISKLWYDGANLIAQDMANNYELTNEQAAAIIATQSPQMPWFDNLHLADVIMNLMHSESNSIFTKELFDYYVSKSEGYAEQKKYIPTLLKAIGTPLSKLSDLDAAIFIRAYYDTKLSRKAPIRIPTGTAISEDQKGDSSFSGYSVIAKGISIFRDGSIENISNQLGEANKVRNFYMNIADPSDKRAVTIDTHAMAIALFKPLASNDYEVNFDAATFAFYADAYRELADELGIEARALQSITWEAARAIFPAKEKAKSGYKEKISNIWDELVSGNKSLYKVQEEIFNQSQDPNITEWSEYINILKDEKARTNVSGRIVGLEGTRATNNMGAVSGTSIGESKSSGRTGVSSRGAKIKQQKTAPNGKPSKLDDVQWEQVRTPAFKKWFGDWENDPQNASKVVDENGEPLVVYHGTSSENKSDIEKSGFDSYKGRNGLVGFSFMSDIKLVKPYNKGAIIDVFLNLRNPIDYDANFKIRSEILKGLGKTFNTMTTSDWIKYTEYISKEFINQATKLGYDGVFQSNQPEINVFKNTNIKIADGTNTTFDATQPSIKLQKTPQETRMDKESEDVFKKSLDRGTTWPKATQNALDYIQKSKWYQDATDVEREQKVRDFKESKKQKLKKAPSVAKIMGTPKPKMVTVNEAAAFKDQLRLEAKAAREAKADLNSKRKSLSDAIKGMVKLGKLKVSQAATIIKRVSQVNLDNPVMVDRLIDYAAKVFERADYQEKLDRAFSYKRAIKKLLKTNNQAQVVGMANEFTKLDPSLVENIDEYIDIAEKVKKAVAPSKAKTFTIDNDNYFDMVLKQATNIEAVSKFVKNELEKQDQQLKDELLATNDDLLESGFISRDMTAKQIQGVIDSMKKDPAYKMDSKEKEGYMMTYLSQRFNSLAEVISDIIKTNQNPVTGERVAIDQKDVAIMSDLLKVDLSEMGVRDALFIVEAMDNFITNGITSKLEGALSTYKGEMGIKEEIKSGKVARPLRLYFTKKAGRELAIEFTPLPLMIERMFNGVKSGISVMKSMGLSIVINGVNKANYLHNKIIDEYYNKFIRKSKTFHTPENVYERGMLAFLKRNVTGSLEEMKAETNRRVKMITQSITTLKNKGDKSQKAMAEIYQKVFDKLDVSTGDIDVIESRASKENKDAVNWWINQWSKHYKDLSDVSLSVYNYDLGSDLNYTPDKYKLIKTEEFDKKLIERNSSFLISMDNYTDKEKTGVLMQSTRPNAMEEGRYVSLDFDANNSNSLKGALVDINTAAGIRQVDGFLNSKLLDKLIPSTEDRDALVIRVNRYIRRSKGKIFMPKDLSKDVDSVINFAASLGVGKALGGALQSVKQTIPIAISTAIMTGKFNIPSVSFNEWLNKTGMPIANRGIESLSTIESMDRRLEAKGTIIKDSVKTFQKISEMYMKLFLSKPDVMIARMAFQSYYLQYMKESSIDWANHTPNQDALNYAEAMVGRQQNINDPMLGGEFLTAEDSMKRISKKVLLPFASFGLNQKARLNSDLINMASKTTNAEDRKIALKSFSATLAEMVAYRAIAVGIGYGFYKAAEAIIKNYVGDDEDDDDDKERDKKWFLSSVKFPLKSMINDLISPLPLTDEYVTMGADYILSQYTGYTEAELDELVKNENEIRGLKDLDPLEGRQLKKFREEEKQKSLYQLAGKYESSAFGMGSIFYDAAKKFYYEYQLAMTGEFKDEYRGNVTTKKIRPVEQEVIKNSLIFSSLFMLGLLPKEADQVTTKVINMIKKNAMSESEYEKYEGFKKEYKREPGYLEMALIRSDKKQDYIETELNFIKDEGGLSLVQAKEYVKIFNLINEVTPDDLSKIKEGQTADQIIKSLKKEYKERISEVETETEGDGGKVLQPTEIKKEVEKVLQRTETKKVDEGILQPTKTNEEIEEVFQPIKPPSLW